MAMTLRLPDDLQTEAQELAQYMGVSLNGLTIMALRSFLASQSKNRSPVMASPVPVVLPAAGMVPQPLPSPVPSSVRKVGANERCPCGNGQKYKRCHGKP